MTKEYANYANYAKAAAPAPAFAAGAGAFAHGAGAAAKAPAHYAPSATPSAPARGATGIRYVRLTAKYGVPDGEIVPLVRESEDRRGIVVQLPDGELELPKVDLGKGWNFAKR